MSRGQAGTHNEDAHHGEDGGRRPQPGGTNVDVGYGHAGNLAGSNTSTSG